jgi:hypothetical protein
MPTVLVENICMTSQRAILIAGSVELMFPVGNTLPALALDRMGRGPTMLVGCGLLSCMMMISILLSIGDEACSTASIAFFFLYMLILGATVNVVLWVWGPEVSPL